MENQSLEKTSPWRIKRYYFYTFITVVALILPWIKVNGNHFFLLSFDKLQLHLAFVKFDMQEMYLMPFILMLLFLGIFGVTVMGGRVFCGWACPQTIFRVIYRDLIETKILGLRKRIKNKQQEPDMSKPENKVKKLIAVTIWTVLGLVATSNFLWYFVPPEDFFAYLANPTEHMTVVGILVVVTLFLLYSVVKIKEDWCVYVCPYSRIQSVLYDEHTVMAIYDPHRGGTIYDENKDKLPSKTQKEIQEREANAECTACESCVTVCPTHIDIRKGLQLECINCLECVDACTTVMGKLGKESLVRWSSDYEVIDQKGKTKLFRTKIIAYIVLLVGVMIALAIMSTKKEHMLLNVNKENRLYSIKKIDNNYRVDNAYEFLLQNTQSKNMKFFFEIIPPKGMEGKIKIFKPSKPFTVVPGVKKKKIVVLRTTQRLVDSDRHDTVIPITIRAYALGHDKADSSPKIEVFRNSTFTYPRSDLLK